MAQQINLFDSRFAPQKLPFGSRQALLAALCAMALALLASLALQWAARDSALQAQVLEQRLAVQRVPVQVKGNLAGPNHAATSGSTNASSNGRANGPTTGSANDPAIDPAMDRSDSGDEVSRLRQLEAGQRRIRAALDGGAAGARDGHAQYLVALARQASGALWITGFAVSDNGQAITLEGRMTEPSVLADYLRRLNAEPRFKGRPFAQLSLTSVEAGVNGAAHGFTEFVLRSRASGENKP